MSTYSIQLLRENKSYLQLIRENSISIGTLLFQCCFFCTGEYLSNRSWQGLDQQLGETPVVKAVEGQFGIAAEYTDKPTNKNLK